MNKQEAITELRKHKVGYGEASSLSFNRVTDIINQIDEPKKVVIPKFVAEWIEECKQKNKTLHEALFLDHYVNEWLEIDDNENTFARAWLDGYEVEKEKLYTVEIPNPNFSDSDCKTVLKRTDGNLIELCVFLKPDLKEEKYQLTESEIDKDFEWAWRWAKPVEVK